MLLEAIGHWQQRGGELKRAVGQHSLSSPIRPYIFFWQLKRRQIATCHQASEKVNTADNATANLLILPQFTAANLPKNKRSEARVDLEGSEGGEGEGARMSGLTNC